jgi:hypothetical protein
MDRRWLRGLGRMARRSHHQMNHDEIDGWICSLKWTEEAAEGEIVRDGTMRSTAASDGEVAAVSMLCLERRRWSGVSVCWLCSDEVVGLPTHKNADEKQADLHK